MLNKSGDGLTKAAEVNEPKSGRVMEVWTTEPALQFYTGNFLDGTLKGKGKTYPHRNALLHGNPALSRFPQQAGLPHHRIEARRNLSHHYPLPLLGKVGPHMPRLPGEAGSGESAKSPLHEHLEYFSTLFSIT